MNDVTKPPRTLIMIFYGSLHKNNQILSQYQKYLC